MPVERDDMTGAESRSLNAVRVCRLCGTTDGLTRHHILKRSSARIIGRNLTIWLCRLDHDRLHKGLPAERAAAYRELRQVLSRDELALLNDPRRRTEHWETKV